MLLCEDVRIKEDYYKLLPKSFRELGQAFWPSLAQSLSFFFKKKKTF